MLLISACSPIFSLPGSAEMETNETTSFVSAASSKADANSSDFKVRPIEEQDMQSLYQFDIDMSKELSSTNASARRILPLGETFLNRHCAPSRSSFSHWRTLVLDFAGVPCGFLINSYERKKLRVSKRTRKSYVELFFIRIAIDKRGKGLSHVLLSG